MFVIGVKSLNDHLNLAHLDIVVFCIGNVFNTENSYMGSCSKNVTSYLCRETTINKLECLIRQTKL